MYSYEPVTAADSLNYISGLVTLIGVLSTPIWFYFVYKSTLLGFKQKELSKEFETLYYEF